MAQQKNKFSRRKRMSQSILVVEDERAIRSMINFTLTRAGYAVTEAEDSATAKNIIAAKLPDLVLIDWMLPDSSGLELARFLKVHDSTKNLGIIMLTAKAEEKDKILGLESGADDYVTKPFSQRELLARIKALLRRVSYGDMEVLEARGISINLKSMQVSIKGKEVHLGPTEFRLLKFLMTNPNRAFSRAQLIDMVWGQAVYVVERTVDVHISRLRTLLETNDLDNIIQTVRDVGYRFDT